MRYRIVLAALSAALVVAGSGLRVTAQSPGARAPLSTQDYIDIQQLYARYALLIDSGDAEGWANTFTPEGVFNNSSRGRDALVQFVHTWREKQNGANLRHWYTNLVITPTAEGAHGAIYMMLLDISKRPPAPTASYLYDDALVKTAAGWRFKTRVLHSETPPASTK
jgi:hypothetical protein